MIDVHYWFGRLTFGHPALGEGLGSGLAIEHRAEPQLLTLHLNVQSASIIQPRLRIACQ